ncbi:MAG: endonuclease/exonuclease/phosphatase family protein [Planctomycetota bacterium]
MRRDRPNAVRTALLRALLLLACWASVAPAHAGDAFAVGTFNIRYANDGDGPNAWRHRAPLVLDVLKEGDFWGLQEALPAQVAEISAALPAYGVLSRTREQDPARGEACPILYRTARWALDPEDHGTVWLSDAPRTAGSRAWDAALPRIATYARFTERATGRGIYVFNTHFDHKGPEARLESARLLLRLIGGRAWPDPVVVLGDLNTGPGSAPVSTLLREPVAALRDAWRTANPEAPEQGTFSGWGDGLGRERIDHIFFSAGLTVSDAAVDTRRPGGRWPSDHAPVRATLAFMGGFKAELQPRARWSFDEHDAGATVRIDNAFGGARVNGCVRVAPREYRIVCSPENTPINPSPWFAFRVQADRETDATFRIAVTSSRSRPWPWISRDGRAWARMESRDVERDVDSDVDRGEHGGEIVLRARVGLEPVWIASAAMVGVAEIEAWTDRAAQRAGVAVEEIGRSAAGRPVRAFEFGAADARHAIVVIGRQHPPEVTGSLGLHAFVDALLADSEPARAFRASHRVLCVPLVNPDGVHEGQWRSTLGAVDANRDWHAFTEPETRAVRDRIGALAAREGVRISLLLDFHATAKDILYVPPDDARLEPADFAPRWIAAILARVPDYLLESSATSNIDQRTFKRWAFETYAAPGITFEFGTASPHDRIARVAAVAAEEAMTLLGQHARAAMQPAGAR